MYACRRIAASQLSLCQISLGTRMVFWMKGKAALATWILADGNFILC
jgi:hypothetical protein